MPPPLPGDAVLNGRRVMVAWADEVARAKDGPWTRARTPRRWGLPWTEVEWQRARERKARNAKTRSLVAEAGVDGLSGPSSPGIVQGSPG